MLRNLLIIYILILSVSASSGQKILKQLTTDDGLSENQCFDIFQDSKGYIWIGTSAGANKYDGKDVINFDRSNGLLSDHIYSFHEDSQERIWINNLNGEPVYIKDDIVHNRFTNPELEEIKSEKYFASLAEDKLKRILFGTSTGVLKILDQDSILKIKMPESVDTVGFDIHGYLPYNYEIIVPSTNYIRSLDIKTFETNWTIPIECKKAFQRKLIYQDKLYLFSLFETYVFDLVKKEFKRIKRQDGDPPIYDCRILFDKLLISTAEGVSILNDSIIVDYPIHPSIDSIAISAIHEDNLGNLWIATLENGIFTFYDGDVEKSKYANLSNIIYLQEFVQDSLFIIQDNWTISLLKDDKSIWKQQLHKMDENRFLNIFSKEEELWVVDKYQIHMDIRGDYRSFSNYSRKVYYNQVDNSYTWIGSKLLTILNDLDLIVDFEEMVDVLECHPEKWRAYDINNPYDFQVEANGKIWVGGEDGLFCITEGKMTRINAPELDGSITELKLIDNCLIGINHGIGLFCYDLESKALSIFNRENNLPTNYLSHIAVNGNEIWVTHATGICLLKKEGNVLRNIKNFGKEHGVPKGRINLIRIVDDVCHFVVNGKTFSIKPHLAINDTLEISMDTSKLSYFTDQTQSIYFKCTNFIFADKISYQYRLMPLDTHWKAANREKIVLEFIPAGEYDLEIRAQHPLNLSNPIKRKPINIKEHWYNEPLFKIFAFLFMGLVLFFLIKIKAISFNISNFKHWMANLLQKYLVKEERNTLNIKAINGIVHLLNIDEILFIKSSGNYMEYHTLNKKIVTRMTMSSAVEKFKLWTDFERVHRSYMVNFKKIEAIDHRILKVGGTDIPFTDTYKKVIDQKLQL